MTQVEEDLLLAMLQRAALERGYVLSTWDDDGWRYVKLERPDKSVVFIKRKRIYETETRH